MKNFIDLSLTPKNAMQKGYKYIGDILCKVNKPNEDIQKLIAEHGHGLSSPSQSKEINIHFGLYMSHEKKYKICQ